MKHDVDQCVLCSLCNLGGEAYQLSKDERRAPRHVVWNLKKGRETPALYSFMLNGRTEAHCPVKIAIDAEVIDGRRKLVKRGVETVENKKMVEKILDGKNPYKS